MFGLLDDVVTIVTAPIKVASSITRVVTKPVAEVAEEVVEAAKDLTEE